jgi:hypothetical protein
MRQRGAMRRCARVSTPAIGASGAARPPLTGNDHRTAANDEAVTFEIGPGGGVVVVI